jgi:hypothetical protein
VELKDLQNLKLTIREVVGVVVVSLGISGSWLDLKREVSGIPAEIRKGDIKGEIQALNMELSYMEGKARDESAERIYQSKTRTLVRLEAEWAEFQK